jgi:hypothetical protein
MNSPHDAAFRLNKPYENATVQREPMTGDLEAGGGRAAPQTIPSPATAFSSDGFFNAALGFGV